MLASLHLAKLYIAMVLSKVWKKVHLREYGTAGAFSCRAIWCGPQVRALLRA